MTQCLSDLGLNWIVFKSCQEVASKDAVRKHVEMSCLLSGIITKQCC